ncbi:polysaccharide deacetylase family protein [[Clostridium] dakarense]|uniref:polysaccharide deacetylase family protein n=1 Tax=Faecalimicrobium dakarense TaxID=1301100 RepID=UPI0004B93CC4|nr:polysaccharide deacetylase family protein [[Clostridium] dakarense]
MRKQNKINFGARKKKKVDAKKVAIVSIASVVIVFVGAKGIGATTAFIQEQRQVKIEMDKKAEEERILAEKKRKEEEEKKKMVIGVNHNGKEDSYDAIEIAKKLKAGDYSNNGEKIVFLTFDDGTSTTVTPEVLKVLDENNVKATFFLTGENIERGGQKAKDLIKQEFEKGHAIANHSYSHNYKILYPQRTLNLESFNADFKKTDDILKDVLGPYFSTRVIRCPGGHMSWKGMEPLDAQLEEKNMASIDWNALSADAEGRKKNAQQLAEYAIKTSEGKEIVVLLMHDTYGKEQTAKSLPQIIKHFKDNGYAFKTLA